jgi:photosystem I P700 chlorophyll a apoprotein A2
VVEHQVQLILLHLVSTSGGTRLLLRSNQDLYIGSIFFSTRGTVSFRWLASPPTTKFQPGLSWFKMQNHDHHLSGLFGFWFTVDRHLIHVAIPEARGQHVRWDNF